MIAVCEKKNHYDLFIYRSALNSLYNQQYYCKMKLAGWLELVFR